MTKYREIIRLTGLGFSQRNIMASCGVAQKTVGRIIEKSRFKQDAQIETFKV